MKNPNRLLATGLATVVLALGACSSAEQSAPDAATAAPAATTEAAYPAQTPEQARDAIAKGTTCKLGKVATAGTGESGGDVPLTFLVPTLEVTETLQSRAAQEQYANDDGVLWHHAIGTQVFTHDQTGYHDKGAGMFSMNAPIKTGNSDASVPTQAVANGDAIAIYGVWDLETGPKGSSKWVRTVSQVPCGVVRSTPQGWEPITDLQLKPHITDYTVEHPVPPNREPYALNGAMYQPE